MALGNALDFDGSNDYVDIGNPENLKITGSAITLVAWVYQHTKTANTYDRSILTKEAVAGGHVLRTGAARVELGITTSSGGKAVTGDTTFSLNAWHLVAGVYNGSTMEVFLDGVSDGSDSHSGTLNDIAANWNVGRSASYNRFFDGVVDEMCIWAEALSANDIADLYAGGVGMYFENSTGWPTDGGTMGTNLKLHYRADESAMNTAPGGTDLEDFSGNGNHGTCFGSMTDDDFVTGIVPLKPAGSPWYYYGQMA